jgi:hypothetical protein
VLFHALHRDAKVASAHIITVTPIHSRLIMFISFFGTETGFAKSPEGPFNCIDFTLAGKPDRRPRQGSPRSAGG